MIPVVLRRSLKFTLITLRRNGLSFGQGTLLIVVALGVFLTGDDWKYGFILWGIVSAQACLVGFWIALADRPWPERTVYSGLHVLGLMFCVLAAGKMHLDENYDSYTVIEVLRHVPEMLIATLAAGLILRGRNWRLNAGALKEAGNAIAARRMQMPLSEFLKWFTLLCVALGLSVSLLPPASLLRHHWLWHIRHTRVSDYLAFFLVVALPGGLFASRIFLETLKTDSRTLRQTSGAAIVCLLAAVLWIGGVLIIFNVFYNVYYLLQLPPPRIRPSQIPAVFVRMETIGHGPARNAYGALASLLVAAIVVANMARLSGWRMRRVGS